MAVRGIFESLKADTKSPLHELKPGIFRLQTSETVLRKQQFMVVGKTAFWPRFSLTYSLVPGCSKVG